MDRAIGHETDRSAAGAWWLLVIPAGLLLATPFPPSPLTYDLSGLGSSRPGCNLTVDHDCADPKPLSAVPVAPPAPPPPIVVVLPPEKGVRMVVSLPQQRLYVFRNGELVTTSAVSTGRRGHGTPAGTFRILQKSVMHRSNLYSNAPMPYMQRLTEGGVALHAGYLPGYPASHGCIRLPMAMAKKLYTMTNFSTTVVTVTRIRPRDADDAFSLVKPYQYTQRPRPLPAVMTPVAPSAVARPQPQAQTGAGPTLS
jgi:hypothetical protein